MILYLIQLDLPMILLQINQGPIKDSVSDPRGPGNDSSSYP